MQLVVELRIAHLVRYQDDSVNCSCFAKTQKTIKLKACSIHVRARVWMSIVQTELYLSVDKLKKKNNTTGKTAVGKRQC